jgi:hypothetical protein
MKSYCLVCSNTHEDAGIRCPNPVCGFCRPYCLGGVGCKWPMVESSPHTNEAVAVQNTRTVDTTNATTTLQAAFESWICSSDSIKLKADIETAWKEFVLYAQEILKTC